MDNRMKFTVRLLLLSALFMAITQMILVGRSTEDQHVVNERAYVSILRRFWCDFQLVIQYLGGYHIGLFLVNILTIITFEVNYCKQVIRNNHTTFCSDSFHQCGTPLLAGIANRPILMQNLAYGSYKSWPYENGRKVVELNSD